MKSFSIIFAVMLLKTIMEASGCCCNKGPDNRRKISTKFPQTNDVISDSAKVFRFFDVNNDGFIKLEEILQNIAMATGN